MSSALITALLVAVRIAATSWANVIQKRLLAPGSNSPLSLVVVTWGWMSLLTIPWWISALGMGYRFWAWMVLTCLLEVPGNVLLLRSLRQTELSIFGPLSSFKPVISLAFAFALFGQRPSLMGLMGVAIVLLGTLWLTGEPRSGAELVDTALPAARRRAGIRDRLLAVVLTAAASVFLKQAMVGHSEPQVLAVWCVVSWLLALAWQATHALAQARGGHNVSAALGVLERATDRMARPRPLQQQQRRAIFLVALGMLVMQACTISLFARMPVGYALALFQIGSLVSVVMGHHLFGEAHLIRRLLAASIMVVGAVVIIVLG